MKKKHYLFFMLIIFFGLAVGCTKVINQQIKKNESTQNNSQSKGEMDNSSNSLTQPFGEVVVVSLDEKNNLINFQKGGIVSFSYDINKNNPFEIENRKPFSAYNEGDINNDFHLLETDNKLFDKQIIEGLNQKDTELSIWVTSAFDMSQLSKTGLGVISYSSALKTPGSHDTAKRFDLASFVYLINSRGEKKQGFFYPHMEIEVQHLSESGEYYIANVTNSVNNPDQDRLLGELYLTPRVFEVKTGKDITECFVLNDNEVQIANFIDSTSISFTTWNNHTNETTFSIYDIANCKALKEVTFNANESLIIEVEKRFYIQNIKTAERKIIFP